MSNLRECLAGVANYDEGLERFMGQTAIYDSFLMRFCDDTSFPTAKEAMAKGDVKDAFTAAHTLKGYSGNLSLTAVYDATVPVVEALRVDDYDAAKDLFPALEQAYQRTLTAIEKVG